jgi:DNA-binding transcriptional LysR family regulator
MELRQLKYYLSVLREGSVSAAAQANFVTQPAVSAQIRRLEEEVGEPLLDRIGRRVAPTQAGRVLAAHAAEILGRVEALERSLGGLKGLESGSLRMGTIDAASVYVLPDVFRAFHRRHPGVRIEVVIGDSAHLLALLRSGRVELASATLPVDGEDVEARAIHREQMLAVAHPSHELSRRRRVSLSDLCDHGVISYPADSTTRRLIEAVFAENGLGYRATMELGSPEAMKRLAQAGLGVSILPRPVVSAELGRRSLKAVALGRVRFEREIGMVYRRRGSLSAPARAFLEMVDARAARRRESRRA